MQKHVNLVDLVNLKSFLTSFSYLLVLANVGFDTAENELSKVCRYQTIPPPWVISSVLITLVAAFPARNPTLLPVVQGKVQVP